MWRISVLIMLVMIYRGFRFYRTEERVIGWLTIEFNGARGVELRVTKNAVRLLELHGGQDMRPWAQAPMALHNFPVGGQDVWMYQLKPMHQDDPADTGFGMCFLSCRVVGLPREVGHGVIVHLTDLKEAPDELPVGLIMLTAPDEKDRLSNMRERWKSSNFHIRHGDFEVVGREGEAPVGRLTGWLIIRSGLWF